MSLTCPYCGSGIEIEKYYDYGGSSLQIECDNRRGCGAQWSPYGELLRDSKEAT
jgi:hypothetical protein